MDLKDAFTFGGLMWLFFGLWLVYPPAAFIVLGVIFAALGLCAAMKGKNNGDP